MKDNKWSSIVKLKSYTLFLLGLVVILIALAMDIKFTHKEKIFTGLFNIGVSILTVGIIAFVWDMLGGDPITNAINRFKKQIMLREIGFRAIKIRYSSGPENTFFDFQEKIDRGAQVDLMGLVLQREWFNKADFNEKCKMALNDNKPCKFRIILPKPFGSIDDPNFSFNNSKNLYLRAYDEQIGVERVGSDEKEELIEKMVHHKAIEMSMGIMNSLYTLSNIYKGLDDNKKNRLEVRVAIQPYINCSVLRINNYICVINYLHKKGGKGTPTIEVEGANKPLFKIYMEEFNTVWRHSCKWNLIKNKIA
jgi:hypothetical protein